MSDVENFVVFRNIFTKLIVLGSLDTSVAKFVESLL